MVTGMDVDESKAPMQCAACIQGKQHVEPFSKHATDLDIKIGEITVSDVWGPAATEGLSHKHYYYSFTDIRSRYSVVYFGNKKNDALEHFKTYKAFVETQTGKKIKRIRTDNGREYVNDEFRTFCNQNGIIAETTAPYSPSQNGIAERLNRTLVEHARAMIYAKNLPKSLWPEAVSYACYIKNCSPVRALESNLTPYEMFFSRKPDVSKLQEFGTRCWVMVPGERRTKLDPKAERHVFTGIGETSKSWRYWNTRSNKIQYSHNITFDESDTTLYPIPDLDGDDVDVDDDSDPVVEQQSRGIPLTHEDGALNDNDGPIEHHNPEPPRHSTRIAAKPSQWDYRTMTRVDRAMIANIVPPPLTLIDAKKRPDFEIWRDMMDTEIRQHQERGTWSVVKLPQGREAIRCRWVYATKSDPDGNFEKAKARLVVQGMTQIPGIDYFDITAPVMKFDSLRILLAFGTKLDWEIEMMDVKGAYLNAELDEDISPDSHRNTTMAVARY
jgi:transposase InsO family protein